MADSEANFLDNLHISLQNYLHGSGRWDRVLKIIFEQAGEGDSERSGYESSALEGGDSDDDEWSDGGGGGGDDEDGDGHREDGGEGDD